MPAMRKFLRSIIPHVANTNQRAKRQSFRKIVADLNPRTPPSAWTRFEIDKIVRQALRPLLMKQHGGNQSLQPYVSITSRRVQTSPPNRSRRPTKCCRPGRPSRR